MTAIMELIDVSKSYGRAQALRGVNLAVLPGSVTCVLGDNGAGKSTLLKILAGAHRQSSGQVLIDGKPVKLGSPRDSAQYGIATVFQNLGVVDLMPVWRNFFLGQELHRGPFLRAEQMRRITAEQMTQMGVPIGNVNRTVGTLSGGQRQCVAIARAAYRGARVLILDEPTASLGVKQAGLVLSLVHKAAENGVGVIMVTHNPTHAFHVGTHFLVLNAGDVVLDAPADQVERNTLVDLMSGDVHTA